MSDFNKDYAKFVKDITSETSMNTEKLIEKIKEIDKDICFARMDTAISGIAGEAGEISDHWKKIKFHGKSWNAENKAKMCSELGDIFWYLLHACECVGMSFEDAMNLNREKLQNRHKGDSFNVDTKGEYKK